MAHLLDKSVFTLAACGLVAGCTLVASVDKFRTSVSPVDSSAPDGLVDAATLPAEGSTVARQFQDLRFKCLAMTPHNQTMFEFRIIDANNTIQMRGVLAPMGTSDITVNVPNAIPALGGPYRLDFYGDQNSSGGYDGLGSVTTRDHAWRLGPPLEDYPKGTLHKNGLVAVTFTHNTIFTDIDTWPSGTKNPSIDPGMDVKLNFTNLGPLAGKLLQARVSEGVSGHVIGLYRSPSINQDSFTATIPKVADVGVDYVVSVYVDANGDGVYDNPATGAGDLGWRQVKGSTATGLSVDFDATATGSAIDVGPP